MTQVIDLYGQQQQAMANALQLLQRRQEMNRQAANDAEQRRQFEVEQKRLAAEMELRQRLQGDQINAAAQNTAFEKMPGWAERLAWVKQNPELAARYGITPEMFPNAAMEQTVAGQQLGVQNRAMNGQPQPFEAAGNADLGKLPQGVQLQRSQAGYLGAYGPAGATAMAPSSSIAYTTPSMQQTAVDRSSGARPSAEAELSAETTRRGQNMQATIAEKQMGMAGQFVTAVDQYGNITGFFNPKTGTFVEPPQGGMRRTAVSEGERTNAATAAGMLSDVQRARELFKANPDAIGPAAGRWYDSSGKLLNGTPRDVTEIHQIVGSLKQRLIYLKSGKQINEEEYRRLSQIMPNVFDPPNRFNVMMDRFETEMNQAVARNAAMRGNGGGMGGGQQPPQGGRKQVLDANGNLVWK